MPRKLFNFEKYATYDDTTKKSTCLIRTCQKQLCGKLKSNIRRHYKLVHKVEINTDGSDCDEPGAQEIIDIKEESMRESVREKDSTNSVEQEFIFEANDHEKDANKESSHSIPPAPIYLPKPNIVEPVATSRENENGFDETLQTCDIVSNNGELKSRPKRKKFPDDESSILNRSENFEDWVNRKKQLLEIEEIEMRHYKIKLELWEREQHLNLKCSKFTKDMKNV